MPNLNMNGPYKLTKQQIDVVITKKSPGNYALGSIDDKTFQVSYVGRSDDDVKGRLEKHIGEYQEFKFSYASSAKEAFEKECKNYHDFGENKHLVNEIHPDRPKGMDWKCPHCKNFG